MDTIETPTIKETIKKDTSITIKKLNDAITQNQPTSLQEKNEKEKEKKQILILDKINIEEEVSGNQIQSSTPNSINFNYTKNIKPSSDRLNTENQQESNSQFFRKDSKLNLSISRISLKNTFQQENINSKLRGVYKKINGESILNITNVKTADNQFIKLFSNAGLYDNYNLYSHISKSGTAIIKNNGSISVHQIPKSVSPQKGTNLYMYSLPNNQNTYSNTYNNDEEDNNLNSNSAQGETKHKYKNSVQTTYRLASDVINIYRFNISNQIKESSETKTEEAKEIILKQSKHYRQLGEKIIKKEHIPEVDVETIMRAPVKKYAKSSFPQGKNSITMTKKRKQSIINNNSNLLSKIKTFKRKFCQEMDEEKEKFEKSKVEVTLRKSMINYESFVKSFCKENEENLKSKIETEEVICDGNGDDGGINEHLFRNKYRKLVCNGI